MRPGTVFRILFCLFSVCGLAYSSIAHLDDGIAENGQRRARTQILEPPTLAKVSSFG